MPTPRLSLQARVAGIVLAALSAPPLLHGVNDLAGLGHPGVTRTAQVIDTMAKEVRNRGARLFLATLPSPRPGGTRSVPASVITAFNTFIATIPAGGNAVLVHVYPVLLSDVTRFVGSDGTGLTVGTAEERWLSADASPMVFLDTLH